MRPLSAATAGLALTLAFALLPQLTGAARDVAQRLQHETMARLELGRALVAERCPNERNGAPACLAYTRFASDWLDRLPQPLAAPNPGEAAAEALLRAGGGGLLLGVILYALTIRPLRRLRSAARRVADGDSSLRLPPGPPNELGLLGRDFNRMTERLSRKALDREEFLARLTHDLRSPLNAILLHAEALLRGVGGPEQGALRESVEALRGEGRRLDEELEDVLELARMESAPVRPLLEPIDLRTELAQALERRAQAGGPAFSCHAIPGAARASADTLGLRPALDQAIRLAGRWARPEEPVTVSVYRGGPGELVLAYGFSAREQVREALALVPQRPPTGRARAAPLSGLEEVRFRRAARLVEAAGGTLALKRHDDGSWSLRVELEEATG